MPIIPKSSHEMPNLGEWSPWVVDGQRTALFCCPDCGRRGTLETHTIGDDGRVTPSVRCNDGCEFHQTGVQLQGWTPN